jgi:hypothetical protein
VTSALRTFDPDIVATQPAGQSEVFSRRKQLLAKTIKALDAPPTTNGVVRPLVNPKLLREAVAVRAYYKAEQRGFEPGHELEDWLEAEKELLPTPAYFFD